MTGEEHRKNRVRGLRKGEKKQEGKRKDGGSRSKGRVLQETERNSVP
jgi:hypothetical protein